MSDLEDMMGGVFEMMDTISTPAVFQIAGQSVSGHLSAATGEITMGLPGKQEKKYRIKAKLSIGVANITAAPVLHSKITGPDKTVYRIASIFSDAAEWLLTLANPD